MLYWVGRWEFFEERKEQMTLRIDLHFATMDIVDYDILSTEVRNNLKFCVSMCECTIDEKGTVTGNGIAFGVFIYMLSTVYDIYIRKGI